MKITKFEDIKAWQEARALTEMIYGTTRGSFDHDLGLANQIERASVSIMANIAEGFEAQSKRKFISYLQIANGSMAEVKSHLYVALDQDYIGQAELRGSIANLPRWVS